MADAFEEARRRLLVSGGDYAAAGVSYSAEANQEARLRTALGEMTTVASSLESIKRQGQWITPLECYLFGASQYDIACTEANVLNYFFLKSTYEKARAALRTIRESPGGVREYGMQTMGWLSIAHFAANFRWNFLYPTETLDAGPVRFYGPTPARTLLKRYWDAARANGRQLFWPLHYGQLFETIKSYYAEGYQTTLGAVDNFSQWEKSDEYITMDSVDTIGFGAPVSGQTKISTDPFSTRVGGITYLGYNGPKSEVFWPPDIAVPATVIGGTGLVLAERVPFIASLLGASAQSYAVASWSACAEWLGLWVDHITSKSFEAFLADAFRQYLDYIDLWPPEILGLTAAQMVALRQLQEQAAREGAAASIGVVGGAAAGIAGAIAPAAGVLIAIAVLIIQLLNLIEPEIRGDRCRQWRPDVPIPPVYRCTKNLECNVTIGDQTTIDVMSRAVLMAERGGISLVPKGAVTDTPPTGLHVPVWAAILGGAAGGALIGWLVSR